MVSMYVATVPNRNSPPAILVREGYREGGKVKTRTRANLSKLPEEAIEAVRRVLKGEHLVSTDELFEIVEDGSPAHGNVEAVMIAMGKLGGIAVLNLEGVYTRYDDPYKVVEKIIAASKASVSNETQLTSDKEKLEAFSQFLMEGVTYPSVSCDIAVNIMLIAEERIAKIASDVFNDAQNM